MGIIKDKFVDKVISKILDFLFKKCKSFLKNKPFYQNLTKTISIDSTCDDFKSIVEKAYHNAASMDYLKDVPQKELRDSLLLNIEVISEWLYSFEMPSFDNSKIRPSNYDYLNETNAFFKSIHNYISEHRDQYNSFTEKQIKESIGNIDTSLNNHISESRTYSEKIIANQNQMLSLLQSDNKISPNWSFSTALNEIEKDIDSRNFNKAKANLGLIEKQIVNNNNQEECKKFYELYTNLLLATTRPQDAAIPYLEKLISLTNDSYKQKKREVLLMILERQYETALECIETLLSEVTIQEDENYLYELKINVLLLTGKNDEAENFINSLRDEYEDSLVYKVRLLNSQGRYFEAQQIINEKADFFKTSYAKRMIRIETLGYAYTQKYHDEGCCMALKKEANALISDCKFLLKEVQDDSMAKEIILISQALLYRIVGKNKDSLDTFMQLKNFNSENPNFLRNYPLEIIMNNGDLQEALNYFGKFLKQYPDDYFIQEAYFDTLIRVDTKEAIKELEKYPIEDKTLHIKIRLVRAYTEISDFDMAEKAITELEEKFPNNYAIYMTKGDLAQRKSKYAEASKEYLKALNLVSDENYRLILIQRLSRLQLTYLRTEENVKNLITLFETIKNEYELFAMFGNEYVCCFIILNEPIIANLKIQKIREYGLLNANILRKEIWCNFTTQNYQKAIELSDELKRMGEEYDETDNKIIRWSQLELGETEKFCASIDYCINSYKSEQEIALLYQKTKKLGLIEKSIEIAHKGYLKYPNSIMMMELFLSSILGYSNMISNDEILKDALECRDKYFRIDRSKRNFKEFYIPKNVTGEQIFEMLNSIIPKSNPIDYIKILDSHKLSLSLLSMTKFNYLYIWKSCQIIDGMYNYISNGDVTDIVKTANIINSISEILIDLPSLVTCAYLDILDLLESQFSKIYILQESINEIEKIIYSKDNPLENDFYACIYRLNGNKYPVDIDVFANIDIENLAIKIKQFMKSSKVIKKGRQLHPKKIFPESLDSLFSKANFIGTETIRYAFESNISVMLEGYTYKLLLNEFDSGLATFSIENLLYRLLYDKKISFIKFCLCIEKLVVSKYVCMTINHQILYRLFVYNGYLPTKSFDKILDMFSNPRIYNPQWVTVQLFCFLLSIWNDGIPYENKKEITLRVFYTLIKRKDIPFGYLELYAKALFRLIKTNQFIYEFKVFLQENNIKIKNFFDEVYDK